MLVESIQLESFSRKVIAILKEWIYVPKNPTTELGIFSIQNGEIFQEPRYEFWIEFWIFEIDDFFIFENSKFLKFLENVN